jgi:hypothetical protein
MDACVTSEASVLSGDSIYRCPVSVERCRNEVSRLPVADHGARRERSARGCRLRPHQAPVQRVPARRFRRQAGRPVHGWCPLAQRESRSPGGLHLSMSTHVAWPSPCSSRGAETRIRSSAAWISSTTRTASSADTSTGSTSTRLTRGATPDAASRSASSTEKTPASMPISASACNDSTPAWSRGWRWNARAPNSTHAAASATNSSIVTGTAG